MPNHPEMRIYTAFNGVESIARCRDERAFETLKNYLKEIGARVSGINGERKEAVFVYLETKEQSDALDEFVKSWGPEGQA